MVSLMIHQYVRRGNGGVENEIISSDSLKSYHLLGPARLTQSMDKVRWTVKFALFPEA